MKTIVDFKKLSKKELRRMTIIQLRKCFFNALISFVLISFAGTIFPASGIWQILVVLLSLFFAFRVMINLIKIDAYARELRHRGY